MKLKIITFGGVCFTVIFAIAIIVANSLGTVIGDQSERNYNRFVQNVDGLTNTFRSSVEECAVKALEQQDEDCMIEVDEEFRIQFGSLIKLFGYEAHIQELYLYWQADLQYWYDSKKIELENLASPNTTESEIKRISEIRDKALQNRLHSDFAAQVESKE